jgi:hypothetical protein
MPKSLKGNKREKNNAQLNIKDIFSATTALGKI